MKDRRKNSLAEIHQFFRWAKSKFTNIKRISVLKLCSDDAPLKNTLGENIEIDLCKK